MIRRHNEYLTIDQTCNMIMQRNNIRIFPASREIVIFKVYADKLRQCHDDHGTAS